MCVPLCSPHEASLTAKVAALIGGWTQPTEGVDKYSDAHHHLRVVGINAAVFGRIRHSVLNRVAAESNAFIPPR